MFFMYKVVISNQVNYNKKKKTQKKEMKLPPVCLVGSAGRHGDGKLHRAGHVVTQCVHGLE